MPARSGTAMRLLRGGADEDKEEAKSTIGCEHRQRSGSTRNATTAVSGRCPSAANRDVASLHYCLQLLIICLWRRNCARPRRKRRSEQEPAQRG